MLEKVIIENRYLEFFLHKQRFWQKHFKGVEKFVLTGVIL